MTNYVHVYKKLRAGVSIKWAPLWKWDFPTCCLPGVWISTCIICNNIVIWYSVHDIASVDAWRFMGISGVLWASKDSKRACDRYRQ